MATSRPSDPGDFSAPDRADDADPSPLRRLVLAQLEEPGGAAVQLLTGVPDEGAWLDATGRAVARELGLDPDRLRPWTPEAYLLQSALGERVLRGDAAPADGGVVALNYHDVPVEHRRAVEERLRRLRDLGPVVEPDADLADASPAGPRVLVGFYDAYRDAALFGADLCHRLGLRAWFFPLLRTPYDEPGAGTLSDAELADLATAHELCFHTASHTRVEEVTEAVLDDEVVDVHRRLTDLAGRAPRTGAWLGGSRWDAAHLGDRTLRDLGLRFHVSNWSLERVPR